MNPQLKKRHLRNVTASEIEVVAVEVGRRWKSKREMVGLERVLFLWSNRVRKWGWSMWRWSTAFCSCIGAVVRTKTGTDTQYSYYCYYSNTHFLTEPFHFLLNSVICRQISSIIPHFKQLTRVMGSWWELCAWVGDWVVRSGNVGGMKAMFEGLERWIPQTKGTYNSIFLGGGHLCPLCRACLSLASTVCERESPRSTPFSWIPLPRSRSFDDGLLCMPQHFLSSNMFTVF